MSRRNLGQASRNSAWLLLGQMAGVLVSAAFAVPAARLLGAHEFGQYAYASTLTSFLTLAASLGIDILLVRNLARDFSRGVEEFSSAVAIRGILWALGMGVLALFVELSGATGTVRAAILVLGLSALPVLLTGCACAVMAAREEMAFVSAIQTGTNVARVVLCLLVLHSGGGVLGVAWASLWAALAGMLASLLLVWRRYGLRPVRFNLRRLVALGRAAAPFGLAGLLFTLYFRWNVVLLGASRTGGEVGLYAVGSRIMEAYLLIPGSIVAASFPILSRLHGAGDASFGRACRVLHRVLLAIAFPTLALLAGRPVEFLGWIFGSDYVAGGPALSILAWLAPLLAINLVLGNALFASGRPGEVLRTEASGVLVSVLAGLLLVPRWGVTGAAVGILLTEVAVVARNGWALRREAAVFPGREAIVPAVPAALLTSIAVAHLPLPLLLALPAGVVVYLVLFVMGGGLRAEELAWVRARLERGVGRRRSAPLAGFPVEAGGSGIYLDSTLNPESRRP